MAKTTHFNELLTSFEGEIYRYVFRMTGCPEDAQDVLQDTFLKAFQAFPRLPDDANHRAWLYKIAHRETLNFFRAEKRRPSAPLDEARNVGDRGGDPEALSETRRLVGALRLLVRDLSVRQRSALLLKRYEGLSYADVAAVLGCTEDNARAHVYQAMQKIRNGLRPQEKSK